VSAPPFAGAMPPCRFAIMLGKLILWRVRTAAVAGGETWLSRQALAPGTAGRPGVVPTAIGVGAVIAVSLQLNNMHTSIRTQSHICNNSFCTHACILQSIVERRAPSGACAVCRLLPSRRSAAPPSRYARPRSARCLSIFGVRQLDATNHACNASCSDVASPSALPAAGWPGGWRRHDSRVADQLR